jgi:hypothetical protein
MITWERKLPNLQRKNEFENSDGVFIYNNSIASG